MERCPTTRTNALHAISHCLTRKPIPTAHPRGVSRVSGSSGESRRDDRWSCDLRGNLESRRMAGSAPRRYAEVRTVVYRTVRISHLELGLIFHSRNVVKEDVLLFRGWKMSLKTNPKTEEERQKPKPTRATTSHARFENEKQDTLSVFLSRSPRLSLQGTTDGS